MAQGNVETLLGTHLGVLRASRSCILAALIATASLGGCTSVPSSVLPVVDCEVSDLAITEYARAAAELHKVEFLDPDVALVEIHRYNGRIGYIASRYVDERRGIEMHRELMIWMQCNGMADTVWIGQTAVYERGEWLFVLSACGAAT